MTLEKAIEIGNLYVKNSCPVMTPDELASYKLGIEAMKRYKIIADNNPLWALAPLEGETKD